MKLVEKREIVSTTVQTCVILQPHRLMHLARHSSTLHKVICAAQLKSEEFEQALSHQHKAMAGDEKGRLALGFLSALAGGENEDGAVQAGNQLRGIWMEAHA